ncbi:amino acid adenylation domain-containing protein [Nonomuraea sp. NPDC050310]|uniref:amino acid adenylation domain-containing protein n=1 Tax=Nonomuraea sp. NPDC050310 TaxID=3154935 RepID=UPI0033DC7712
MLSYGQERLWFLTKLDPEDPSYNCSYAYLLRGPLDVPRLERAFAQVAARHEALRTRFEEVEGRPRAVVEAPGPVAFERLRAGDDQEARRIVRERTNAAFDLAAAPPFRVTLVELGPDEHVLCVVLHHINGDGWSLTVLGEEVAACYAGAPPTEPAPRPERHEEADLGWWTAKLAGVPVLELATDRPRPARRGTRGGVVRFTISPELAAEVGERARQARCTPFMALLTAYQRLLAAHSGQDDFCVGVPTAGRSTPELERAIGYLSTTMVLRCDLSGAPTPEELLRRTRKTVLEAMARPDVPVDRLITALGVERDLSRTPLYQTLFALHTQAEVAEPVPGLAAEPYEHGWHPARHDLTLDLYPQADGGLLGEAIYSEELFDRETVERMAERYLSLLRTGEPLPEAERERLAAWNDTAADLPDVTVVDLVLRQAEATPDARAVDRLSYRELVTRAGGVAADLRRRGVGPGDLVAVRLPRGPDMVVALLGVAMAGAAYLPVDPDYPEARVAFVLEDSGARLVLTEVSAEPAEPVVTRADTAYVLYTSGSTGRPKGVVIPHRALVNFLLAMRDLLGAGPKDVWLALTSLSFDISGLELYLPLITGGRLVVAEDAWDAGALAALVRAEGVTHVQATPSGWRVLLTADLPRVTGLVGGEPLPVRLAAELRERTSRLINMYGPTETTIWSSAWEVPEAPERVSIGRPLANTTLHVVGRDGTLLPEGVPGELLIGGAGLATGYLGRPELTAERFVEFGGERVYRTGDLVRRLPGGELEFLGRTDTQVKLRGHRIELGEIEAVLESAPGVRQAVAAVREELLVAYLVGGDPAEAREHAAARLPGYMVPATLIPLDKLPLTPNGKVDRNALPRPQPVAAGYLAPRGDAEALVAEVYAEVLELEKVGALDDFFALGGHSLSAVRVIARLRATVEVEVPIRALFAGPTVAELAAVVEDLLLAELGELSDEEAERLAKELT